MKSIRTQTTLPQSVRELAICRVAVLNQAWYEWDQHSPILAAANAVPESTIKKLKTLPAISASSSQTGLEELQGLDERHLAVLEYTDAMTKGCIVPQPLFDRIRKLFSEREVTELTATVAAYNCVSRFLVALDVGEMGEKYGVDMS